MPYIKLYEESGGITYRVIPKEDAKDEIRDYHRKKIKYLDVFFVTEDEFILWEGIVTSYARLKTRLRLLQATRDDVRKILLERWK